MKRGSRSSRKALICSPGDRGEKKAKTLQCFCLNKIQIIKTGHL